MDRWSALLRQRSFVALLATGSSSLAAPAASLIVVSWAIASAYPGVPSGASFSALALAFLGLSSTVPTLLAAIFSGTLADRVDRRSLMRWVNLVALLATAAIAVVLFEAPGARWYVPGPAGFYLPEWVVLLYPLWAIETASITLFRPAFNASLPRVVRRDQLGSANGLVYATAVLLSVGAGLGAGALANVPPIGLALSIPLALFLLTQAAIAFLEVDLRPEPGGPAHRFFADAREGYRYLWSRRDLLQLTLSALAINFFSAVAFVELGLYARFWLDAQNPILLGALISGGSLGAAVGTLAINRFAFEHRAGRILALLVVGQGATVVVLGLVRTVWVALPDMFLFGLFPGMFMTVFLATVQATVPDRTLGRVLAADEVGSYGLVPVGQWIGGLVTVALGLPVTYVLAGIGTAVVGTLMGLSRPLRRLGFEPQPPTVEVTPAPVVPSTADHPAT